MSTGKDDKPNIPNSLRVLIVDSDFNYLEELKKMSLCCGYKVSATTRAIEALSILRESGTKFDIVISDINIHDMDVFEFINIISVKMDLPLVLVSASVDNNMVVKGLNSGACDFLLKPIQTDNIKFIWKHVVRKQNYKAMKQSKMESNVENCEKKLILKSENLNAIDEENVMSGSSSTGGVENDNGVQKKDEISQKKQRIVWTPELHTKFVAIVNQIGVKNAVPKKILEMMNVPGITRENVASHLQKYRMFLRKEDESIQKKQQLQCQAINVELNPQMYSYSGQNQVNLDPTKLQQLGQLQNQTNSLGYISHFNQIAIKNYAAAESRFGTQIDNSFKQENFSRKFIPEADQFSGFRIGDDSDIGNLESSYFIQRPSKIQKLSHDEDNEALRVPFWQSNNNVGPQNDFSSGMSSQFYEQLSFTNSGKVFDNKSGITGPGDHIDRSNFR